MKTEFIRSLTDDFEGHAKQTEGGIEFWLARDVQHLLGYAEWRNFSAVINKAKTACEVSGHLANHHFVDVNKMIQLAKGAEREVPAIFSGPTRSCCRHHPTSEGRYGIRPAPNWLPEEGALTAEELNERVGRLDRLVVPVVQVPETIVPGDRSPGSSLN